MAKVIKIDNFLECNNFKRPGGVTPVCDHPKGPGFCNGFDKDCPLADHKRDTDKLIADAAREWLKYVDKTGLPNSLSSVRLQENIQKAIDKEAE